MAQTGTMQSGSRATLSVEWKQANGQPARVDGETAWTSSDESVIELSESAGNSQIVTLISLGPTGTVQIQASADADMGDGMKPVTSVMDITVIGGEAEGGEITLQPMK